MKLFVREMGGEGRPILILHGLFGSSKNWITNGKFLTQFGKVYLLDARNHGESPHGSSHSIEDLVEDLNEFIEDNQIKNPIIIGHSMGGLTVIAFALKYSKKTDNIIIIDIVPKSYELSYEKEFRVLETDVSHYSSRQDADKDLEKVLHDSFIRQFLLMNLERTENGFKWKLNVKVLRSSRDALSLNLSNEKFEDKALFVIGENSEYVSHNDFDLIKKFFPNADIEVVKGAGHYLHYTHSKEFLDIVGRWCENSL